MDYDNDDNDVSNCDNDITMLILMLKLIIDDIDRLITIHIIIVFFSSGKWEISESSTSQAFIIIIIIIQNMG
jgi:hypothetical protein